MYQPFGRGADGSYKGVPVQERRSGLGGVDRAVFIPAAVVALAFVLWGVLATDGLASTADSVLSWLIESFGWLFVLSTLAFVAFAIFLGMSRYGKIRLGKDGEAPEFRKASWVAMRT
jgi:glycine betaine transporter